MRWARRSGLSRALNGLVLVLAVFVCRAFQESVHPLSARNNVRDAPPCPIGGLAAARFPGLDSGLGLSEPANRLRCDRQNHESVPTAPPGQTCALHFPDGGTADLDCCRALGRLAVRGIEVGRDNRAQGETLTGGVVLTAPAPAENRWLATLTKQP